MGVMLLAASRAPGEGSVPGDLTPPKIFGIAEAGTILKASHGRWSGSPTSYLYRWKRCNPAGRECKSIAGASAKSYLLGSADAGATLRVAATAINAAGRSKPARSAPTAIITGGGLRPPANLQPPALAGLARVGLTLTAIP